MADCGASGTALDRAARAVLGNSGNGGQSLANATSKNVSTFLGHSALGAALQQHAPMPMAPPEHLAMPGAASRQPVEGMTSNAPASRMQNAPSATAGPRMDAVWQQQSSMPMHYPGMNDPRMHHPIHPPPVQMQMHSAVYQQQQQHLMMQQHMMFQQQQQQILLHQNMLAKQQALSSSQISVNRNDVHASEKHTTNDNGIEVTAQQSNPASLDTWHEGLEEDFESALRNEAQGHEGLVEGAKIEDLAAAWAEAQENEAQLNSQGHEGLVEGAKIEDLAAAWAEAQEDYAQYAADFEETSANLWSGADAQQASPPQYEFTHKDLPATVDHDWMAEGLTFFREGNLKAAIRSFEMELQHHDPDNATAWRMLGRCHAENDQDPEAIACLEQAVERDPYSPEALLALGVSYVNELDHDRALANLKLWITHNPKYAGLELGEDVYGEPSITSTGDSQPHFDEVQRLLLRALEFDSNDAADVWEALGVVYNVSRDYDAAVNSFRKAIQSRPDDYQLWNKLGATLANSNQSDKALPAYHKALELKPKYARAWLNMAISHSNLEDYHEAARCYLQTLSLNPSATHCWSYLRVALSCSENWELLPAAGAQDLDKFKQHFDFVTYDNSN